MKYYICILISFFVIETNVYAQDSEVYKGMTWYLKKSVAIDSARSQGKQVFLLWGRTTCGNSMGVRKTLSEYPLKPVVDEHYILWFSDCDIYNRNSSEVGDYLSILTGSITLPALCIIDMYDEKVAHGLTTGPKYIAELRDLLNQYVSNDYIADKAGILNSVYISGNNLVIKNESEDEIISVYSITGSLTDRFRKTGYDIMRDLSGYSKGIFIVSGSSGWTQKVYIR